jgi:muramoyltetrapeptide carboxypeptidase LdcA involved in peptidoglycan recycling
MTIKYPKKINKNDIIGVTATSFGQTEKYYADRFDNAIKYLKGLGYDIKETANVRTMSKLVSSDAKTRAKEFMELWKDDEISCIAQVAGGELLMEILPHIDAEVINNYSPKWVFGYSDSSLFNFFLTTNFNVASLTCDNIPSFGMEPVHKSILDILSILEGKDVIIQDSFELYEGVSIAREERVFNEAYDLTDKVEYKHLYNKNLDKISGRLIGGCIDVLLQLLGMPYDNTKKFCKQFDGMIWYLENCELSLPSLYRGLWQMKQAGWFDNANGFLIGRTASKESYMDFEYLDALHKIFDDMNVPVIYDVDIGHIPPQFAMINGSEAEFEYNNGKGKLLQTIISMEASGEKRICPLCGKDNNCQHGQKECWCSTVEFPQNVIDMIPEDKKGKACVCKSCLERYANSR